MRRPLIISAVLVLSGAVVNVAVAWACGYWVDVFHGSWTKHYADYEIGGDSYIVVVRIDRFGSTRIILQGSPFFSLPDTPVVPLESIFEPWGRIRPPAGAQESLVYKRRSAGTPFIVDDGRGWPVRAMWSGWSGRMPANPPRPTALGPTEVAHGIEVESADPLSQRVLPLAIWLPGFAINTLFYAAILWLLFFGSLMLLRYIRMRRGLCPTCAYPMADGAICTECGKPLPKRAVV